MTRRINQPATLSISSTQRIDQCHLIGMIKGPICENDQCAGKLSKSLKECAGERHQSARSFRRLELQTERVVGFVTRIWRPDDAVIEQPLRALIWGEALHDACVDA